MPVMRVLTFSDARRGFKSVLDRVRADRCPAIVARQSGEAVVPVSLSDLAAMDETRHLLSRPANAGRLGEAMLERVAAD